MTCGYHDNCRTHRSCNAHGGSDILVRKLKYWCVIGHEDDDKDDHRGRGLVANEDVLDHDVLDAMPLAEPKLLVRKKKRMRRS